MSDPNSGRNEERPTIEGTDPDMNVGAGRKFDAEDGESDDDESDEDRIDVEDLP